MEQYENNSNTTENSHRRGHEGLEDSGQHEESISKEETQQIIGEIKDAYQEAIDRILEDEDSLKQKILDYFVKRADVDNEYNFILSNLSDAEKRQYVGDLRNSLKDSSTFVSKMERYFTTQDIYQSEKELKERPRTATPEEYAMGVYSDFLEPQVREAVFTLNKKGYRTFQSGYSEKVAKDQFVDVYNSDVEIPEDAKEILRSYGIEAHVENLDDRTTITLHPTDTKKIIRQEEWKKIWDDFSEQLPEADPALIENIEEPALQRDFRRVQDLMKKIKES